MSDVDVVGTAGTHGTNGSGAGAGGGPGGAGGYAYAYNPGNGTDTTNTAEAVGGAGGRGGYGGNPGGPAGAGGAGGNAKAKTKATLDTASSLTNTATATGGPGGNAGFPADGAGGHGAAGAAGGSATASAYAHDTSGRATANATATGGDGGNASHNGYVTAGPAYAGGAGGTVSGTTAAAYGASAYATVRQTGGSGGKGYSQGGAGASSTLANAATGKAYGGTLSLAQYATGGSGGYAVNGPGGTAGDATSSLTVDDTTGSVHASYLRGTTSASAGDGGGAGTGGTAQAGGTANAETYLTGTGTVRAKALVNNGGYGGTGGAGGGNTTTPGAAGGDASGATTATSTTQGSNNVTALTDVTAGAGGSGGTYTGGGAPGGAGGNATGASAIATETQATGGLAYAYARQTGGAGGRGVGAAGGAGGTATNTTASASGFNARAKVRQTGGAGGIGEHGDTPANNTGGAAADSTLNNAVTGTARGGYLDLYQAAIGGTGGSSDGGAAAAGGAASSTLSFDDVTANSGQASTLRGVSKATGGAGGHGTAGTSGAIGGTGTASASMTGAGTVAATADAYGGGGGYSTNDNTPANGGDGAAATVTGVSATTSSTTDRAGAYGHATGGTGGTGRGAGATSGTGGAATVGPVTAYGGSAYAEAFQYGGAGGTGDVELTGTTSAAGGDGADSTLTNDVSGKTRGGTLRLSQTAGGGIGGGTHTHGTAGAGGAGTSALSFDDTANPTSASYFRAYSKASGGSGGGVGSDSTAGVGGAGNASLDVTGANTMRAISHAYGGGGGGLPGGSTGSGAAGGTAQASTKATTKSTGSATVRGYAYTTGGSGGSAGSSGGNGGVGGAVTDTFGGAYAASTNGGGSYGKAHSHAGDGGTGWGAGYTGGAGGAASGTTATATGYSASATAYQRGGSGGGGDNGAAGGAGADSTLANAVSGTAHGGNLTLEQTAIAGSGGDSEGATGGVAGVANSSLTFDDSTNTYHASSVSGTSSATGGAGGGGTTPQVGGTGTAYANMSGANGVSAEADATGGAGGAAYHSGTGAMGAGASATATGNTSTSGSSSVDARATARGGSGGDGGSTNGGTGGAGGAPTGASAVATQSGAATGGTASATAGQYGGSGGTGFGAGNAGGAGGAVSGANLSASASGYNATATATQTGGDGGSGSNGATGGAGADSSLTNAVTGTALGTNGDLRLNQTATGGAGGDSSGGAGGAAGDANSSLTFDDTTVNPSHEANDVSGESTANGGAGGNGTTAQAGGTGTATANITGASAAGAYAYATGGRGGTGSQTAAGAAGGAAYATSTVTSTTTGSANVTSRAFANGGDGGSSGTSGNGGAGGRPGGASATATEANAKGGTASAWARQIGGDGGTGWGAGYTGGAGGAASDTTATATGYSAIVTAYQRGGAGGGGYNGAAGGAGADSTLTNAVSGTAHGGNLSLRQYAHGGAGGYASGTLGGVGGAASSSLTFVDTTAGYLQANVGAYGGAGGGPTATRAAGGAGTATVSVTGAGRVVANATAQGGNSGDTGANATGTATAASTGTGTADTASATVQATAGTGQADGAASATAGATTAAGQLATATANAFQGAADITQATAATAGTGAVTGLTAVAQGTGGGTVTDYSKADIDNDWFNFNGTSNNAYAFAAGLPYTGYVSSTLDSNANVAAKLGTSDATVLGEGIGGGYAESNTTGDQEYKTSLDWTLNATGLTGHMIVGLVGSQSFGTGFDSLGFSAVVGGTTVLDQTFNTLADATTYFNDDALDLGAFTATAGLTVDLNFDLKTSTTGSGFAGQFLLGVTGGNGPPVFTAPASAVVVQNVSTAINGISLSESGNTASPETFTVTLTDTNGVLAATGFTSSDGGHTLTITDSLTNVNADLATLTDTDATQGADTITLNATDSYGGTAVEQAIDVTANSLPAIAAPAAVTIGVGKTTAISGVGLAENGNTNGETFTVTLADTNGVLAATSGSYNGTTHTLTISGSLDQVNSALATLTDTDATTPSDTITLNATDSLGSSATQQTIAVTVAAGPVISVPTGAVVGVNQPSPVSGISIDETNAAADETFTVTLSDNNGKLSATGASGNGTTAITINGSLADVNAALATLTDTDGTAATGDTIAVAASDSFGNDAGGKSVPVTVNGVPDISAPSSAALIQGRAGAISNIYVGESGDTDAPESFTVTLADTNGLLSVTGSGVTGNDSNALTIHGTLSQVDAVLATLTDTDGTVGTDIITLNATDSFGNKAAQQTIGVSISAAPLPVITVPASTVILGVGKMGQISGVGVSEAGATGDEQVTVTLSDTHGTLAATGGTFDPSTHTLTISGTFEQVYTALGTLSDTDATAGYETITVNAKDSFNDSATAQTISVQVDGLPVINAPASATIGVGHATALGVSLSEDPNSSGETFTVTLNDAHGALSASAGGGSATITGSGSTALMIHGTLSEVNDALATLTDTNATAGTDPVTLTAGDSFDNSAARQTVSVMVNGLPVITAPSSVALGVGQARAINGVSLSESGDTSNETFTVTVGDTHGLLSATADVGNATINDSGTTSLTISGSLADVNDALATLIDSSSTTGGDTISLTATDTLGNSTAAATDIAVTVNTAPAISAPLNGTAGVNRPAALANVTLAETGSTAGETFTVTLSDSNGLFSTTGTEGTVSGGGSRELTIQGTLAQVNADLGGLSYVNGTAGTDQVITLNASDGFGNSAAPASIDMTVNGAPTVSAPTNAAVTQGFAGPIPNVRLSESGDTTGESFTVILSDTNGDLSAGASGGATVAGAGTTTLKISGTLDDVNNTLATLTDKDSSSGTDSIAIAASDGFGNTGAATIAVTSSPAVSLAPSITAPADVTVVQNQPGSIGGISLSETGIAAGETFTVTLSDTNGDFSAAASGAAMVTGGGSHAITISGSLADVNSTLQTLTDTDAVAGTDSVAVAAHDSRGGDATGKTIAVAVNGEPVITAPPSVLVGVGQPGAVGGVSLSEDDAATGETFTVTLTDTGGDLSATASGTAAITGAGSTHLTIRGTFGDVNATLATLTDTDATTAADTIVAQASDSRGSTGPLADIGVQVNGLPVIAAPASAALTQGQSAPIPNVSLSEGGDTTGETFTVTLSDANGDLAVTGTGVTGSGGTSVKIVGTLTQVNAALATLADDDASTAPDTITLNASDSLGNSATPATIAVAVRPSSETFTLTTHADTVNGGAGDDIIVAAARTLSTGDRIDGGGGTNTLDLQGAGMFDLRAPATLENVQVILAQEGQAIYASGGHLFPAQNQIIYLRDGLDATVNVNQATLNPDDPRPAVITIYGAHNADVINLASGNDIVTVGDARETVHGGSGDDIIRVTAATIGATIDGGTGNSTLEVTGSGTATMGNSITNIKMVELIPGASTINFISNAEAGLTVDDTGRGADTVTAGGAGQTLTGGAGHETFVGASGGPTTFRDTAAAFNGDVIKNFAIPNSMLDFTDVTYGGGGVVKSFNTTNGLLTVSDGTHTASVTLKGSFSLGNFSVAADSSGHGTAITYIPAAP